ncbi:EamA family transporter [Candidatus Gracilibacteria bacterium]|nr:EamA family transporter [Candidatus Gracilibacteria bacterium]
MNKKYIYLIGSLSVIFAATLWSLDGMLIRPQFYHFPAITIVFLEHFLGSLILSPFLFLSFGKIKTINRKVFISLFWVCLFGGLIGTLSITEAFFAAFRGESSLSVIVILQKLQPIFAIVLAAILLKEKLTKIFYLWAMIALVSVYFIVFPDIKLGISGTDFFNIPAIYAIVAAFSFGSSTVLGKTLVDDLGFSLSTALRFLFTSILAFFTLLISGNFFSISSLELLHWELLGVIVVTSGAFAMVLYYYGLKKIKASSATIFELAWPLSAIFFDYIFNGKLLTPIQFIASGVLILCFFMIINEGKKIESK